MRVGIRGAISGLVLTSIIVSAVGVHLLWWRTAQQVSQTLADTITTRSSRRSAINCSRLPPKRGPPLCGAHIVRQRPRYRERREANFSLAIAGPADHFRGSLSGSRRSFFAGLWLAMPPLRCSITSRGQTGRPGEYEGNEIRLRTAASKTRPIRGSDLAPEPTSPAWR